MTAKRVRRDNGDVAGSGAVAAGATPDAAASPLVDPAVRAEAAKRLLTREYPFGKSGHRPLFSQELLRYCALFVRRGTAVARELRGGGRLRARHSRPNGAEVGHIVAWSEGQVGPNSLTTRQRAALHELFLEAPLPISERRALRDRSENGEEGSTEVRGVSRWSRQLAYGALVTIFGDFTPSLRAISRFESMIAPSGVRNRDLLDRVEADIETATLADQHAYTGADKVVVDFAVQLLGEIQAKRA